MFHGGRPSSDKIVVRNWGALIGLGGLRLIYGAFNESAQRVVLTVTAATQAGVHRVGS